MQIILIITQLLLCLNHNIWIMFGYEKFIMIVNILLFFLLTY